MEDKKVLFIEGEPQTSNGNLRQGFENLLGKKLAGKLPRIRLGGGKKNVADQYLNNDFKRVSFLLFDLDGPEEKRKVDLQSHGLSNHGDNVFYMIQEMESWFLSQPDVLDSYYGKTITGKKISEIMTKQSPAEIPTPKKEMKKITQNLNKGKEYQEVKHATELLKRLDATKLENDFPDFKRLIEQLK